MKPVNGKCEMPEQKLEQGVITISSQRSGYNCSESSSQKNNKAKKSPNKGNIIHPIILPFGYLLWHYIFKLSIEFVTVKSNPCVFNLYL